MLNKNQFIGMPIPGQNQFKSYSNNNSRIDNFLMENINDKFNNLNEQKFNIVFNEEGHYTNIAYNLNKTVEDVLKNYAKRVWIKIDNIYNNKILFFYDDIKINPFDKTKIGNFFPKFENQDILVSIKVFNVK